MTGTWTVNVSTSMPQKVSTAVGQLADMLIGAEYEPIAYLGSQLVNGTNHAVLAKQTVLAGKDTTNVVVLIFNEKGMDCSLVNIERVVESGAPLGGTKIDVQTTLSTEMKQIWDTALSDFVGANITPIASLGTQVTKGTNYIFVATVAPVTPNPVQKVAIVTVNPMTKDVFFADLLETNQAASLGYAFSWLRG